MAGCLAVRRYMKVRKLKRSLLVGVGLYLCLWLITALVGSRQIEREALRELRIVQPSTNIPSTLSFPFGPVERDVRQPYHWCVSRAYSPFVIRIRSGVSAGGYAHGEDTWYFWFFGTSKILRGTKWIT